MLVQVDFYKQNGKWYDGGEVEIDPLPHQEGIVQSLIKNQKILVPNWWNNESFFVVLSDLPESHKDRNYRTTYNRLYKPETIAKVMRGE